MTLLEVRTHPTLLDFGPIKLPGLSRNVPQVRNQGILKVTSKKNSVNGHSPYLFSPYFHLDWLPVRTPLLAY